MLERAGILDQRARKVMVIDDDQDFADSLANLLTLEGYAVERAYSAAAAHAVLARSKTEVALIDIRLGESSGIELIGAFRRRRPDIICLMMTAYASVETAIEALQQGAYDYLCKPFFTEDLLATLERCFDRLTLARERDAVEAALRRRNQELEQTNARLHRVVQSMQDISGCLTLGDLHGTLLEEVAGNLAAAGGAIWLQQDDRLVRSHAIGDAGTATGSAPDEQALAAPPLPGSGSSSLALPLRRDGGQPIGFVAVHAGVGRTFAPQDQELALILTSFGGQAIRVLEALENLRCSEERLRRITENSPSAISLRDLDGRFLIVNRQFEAWHGVGAGVAGRTVDELLPPDLARLYAEQDRDVLVAGRAVDREVEMPFSDGTVHAVLMTTFPVQGKPGAPMGVGTIGTDVSAHVRAEEQLRQAQKMEALGQLTGGVAHDFNNLLAVILGNLELLQEELHDGSEMRELVEDALESACSGVELTHRLLAFGRRQTLHPQATDLRQLILDMSRLLERTLGETIEVVKVLPDRLWSIEVDRHQVESSLLNLAINARDAMPDGGTLTIETANVDRQARTGRHDTLAPGHYVMIAVGDTGVGMPPEVVERAFQPFFTTKEVGQGSGLGLSMVYGFAKQSGGSIEIASEPGRGSTVRLYLPRATTGPIGLAAPQIRHARGQGETILVVEDRPDVRKLARNILARQGYRVLEAPDGPTALTLLRERPEVDLMLADVVLPGRISGVTLAREASARHPNLKILYTSGYAPDMAAEGHGAPPGIRLIKKPFRKDELAAIVRSTLDGAAGPR